MRIQDTFHPDGLSYESGDDSSETESNPRSSIEKLNDTTSLSSSPNKNHSGKIIYIKYAKTIFEFFS
jgi:hypothetical protein